VLPGLTWGPLVLPGAPTPLHAIGRAVGVSLLIAPFACTVLAAIGLLHGPVVAAVLVALTLAPLAVSRIRVAAREVPRRLRGHGRWWLGAAAALGVVGLVVVGRSIADAGADLLPSTSTPWYYMAVARLVAEAGSIPATIAEWGRARPFPTDYLPATTHAAAALELIPGGLLVAVAWYPIAGLGASAAPGRRCGRRARDLVHPGLGALCPLRRGVRARRLRCLGPERRDAGPSGANPARLDVQRRPDVGLLRRVRRPRPGRPAAALELPGFRPAAPIDPQRLARSRRARPGGPRDACPAPRCAGPRLAVAGSAAA